MNLWTDIVEFFFPRLCLSCGRKLLLAEEGLCISCLAGLPYTKLGNTPGNEMEKCFWGRFPVVRASSLFYYAKGGNVRQLLYELKYHGNQEVGEVMGRMMASELMCSHFFDGIDLIVPVPLHQRKKRLRGYNQSECLARGVSVVTGIPMDTKVVIRSRYTDTQTHKGQYARWENVRNLFACIFPDSLEGKHLLLVDDVLTTGATVVSCADAFRGIPGLRISVLTLALAGES